MALKTLSLETLKDCDYGKADKQFKLALERAVRDCLDRPGDERVRTVGFQIELVPVQEIHDNVISCEGATGKFKIQCKLPHWETPAVSFGVKTNGAIFFNDESPRDVRQGSLGLEEEDCRGV